MKILLVNKYIKNTLERVYCHYSGGSDGWPGAVPVRTVPPSLCPLIKLVAR